MEVWGEIGIARSAIGRRRGARAPCRRPAPSLRGTCPSNHPTSASSATLSRLWGTPHCEGLYIYLVFQDGVHE